MMNIYDCFSPTILIIYRYFQFSSSRSTAERRASPGALERTPSGVASRLLPPLGPGRARQRRGSIGMQSRAARPRLREARCLGQPRRLLDLCAGLAAVHWLLQPLRLRRAAPAHPRRWAEGTPRWPRRLPGLLALRRGSEAEAQAAGARAAIRFDPSVVV